MTLSPFTHLLEPDVPAFSSPDDRWFYKALKNARCAMGSTHPNPSVGAVIVKDGVLIAEGFTQPVGGRHAEKQALSNAQKNTDFKSATMYVTLEPCCHYGRTPPCTLSLIEAGISRVVYGSLDPNPVVSGQGIAELKKASIEVEQIKNPLLQSLAAAVIRPFSSYILKKRPFVVVKVATSLDNKIAAHEKTRTKITGPESDLLVHQLRAEVDAIVVGASTVRIDNPRLTARGAEPSVKQPARVVLSADLNLDETSLIFDTSEAKTWVICGPDAEENKKQRLQKRGVEVITCTASNNRLDLVEVLKKLAEVGFTAVLIEAGKSLLQDIIACHISDEIWWFINDTIISESGLDAGTTPKLLEEEFATIYKKDLGSDKLLVWQPR